MSGFGVGTGEERRLAALRAETDRIAALFARAGAGATDPPALMEAGPLLDLYGEDLRARAFATLDPHEGEMVLRPDFTVPVARRHGAAGPARYAYCGPVWRRQAAGSGRPVEYLQAGAEFFGDADRAEADAEIFALTHEALGGAAAVATTGDLGVIFAAIDALAAPDRRRAALHRHVWRPHRFQALLDRFAGGEPAPGPRRAALIAAAGAGAAALDALIAEAGEFVGAREAAEIRARARDLAEDAATPPLGAAAKGAIEAIFAVRGPSGAALARLRDIAADIAIGGALDAMEARLAALAARGIDAEALPFDAAFGRGLEYYDGFVFEFRDAAAPESAPLGGGGRYDALTARLAGDARAALPAVGGVVRPEQLLAARARGRT